MTISTVDGCSRNFTIHAVIYLFILILLSYLHTYHHHIDLLWVFMYFGASQSQAGVPWGLAFFA